MRILHLSDVHIGVENYGRPATQVEIEALPPHFAPGVDRDQYLGVSTRLLDFLATLDEAINHALNHQIDLVLFAGDAYKSRDPTQTHQREFARRIARLSDAGIPVFLTVGNHDLPHVANRATALEIFPTLQVPNVIVGSDLDTHLVNTGMGPIQIVSLPWIRIGAFMAREETRSLTLEQITQEVERRLTELLQAQLAELDGSIPAVLCGHVTASSAQLSSERSMMLGNDHVLTQGTLADPRLDYVALGHIHKHQVLSQHPFIVYPGSLQRIDFSEEHDTKGFCVIDLDATAPQGQRITKFEFIPVAARPFFTLTIKTSGNEDPTMTTLAAIERVHSQLKDTVIRVQVTMAEEAESQFREGSVRIALESAHYIAGIERKIERSHRTRLSTEAAETLSPIEVFQQFLDSRKAPIDRKKLLIEHAQRLIQEELEGDRE